MHIKTTCNITSYMLEWLLPKKQEITNNGEDVKQIEQSSYNAGSYNNNNSTTLENSLMISYKTNIHLLDDPAILLGIYSRKLQNKFSKRYFHFHVHWNIIHSNQEMETT